MANCHFGIEKNLQTMLLEKRDQEEMSGKLFPNKKKNQQNC